MKPWLIAVVVVVVIAVGVGGFFAGKATGGGTPTLEEALAVLQSSAGAGGFPGDQSGFPRGTDGSGPGGAAGGFTVGSIIAQDSSSITVQLSDGNTKIVFYSDSTAISESKDVSKDALVVGADVTVTGSANTDGSVTAARIQLGTAGFSGGQGGAPGGAGGTTGSSGTGSAPAATTPST